MRNQDDILYDDTMALIKKLDPKIKRATDKEAHYFIEISRALADAFQDGVEAQLNQWITGCKRHLKKIRSEKLKETK